MEKLLVKVDGCYIFAPNEEQWAGMDSLMKTIVKKVGGLIDFPLKDRLIADYNTCKLHKKYDLNNFFCFFFKTNLLFSPLAAINLLNLP